MPPVTTCCINSDLYSSLYVIWAPLKVGNTISLASLESYEQADQILDGYRGFQAYLYDINAGRRTPSRALAIFALVRLAQLRVLRPIVPLSSRGSLSIIFRNERLDWPNPCSILPHSTESETVIRHALTQLLDGLSLLVPNETLSWRSARHVIEPALFGYGVMEARIDGVLADRRTDEVFAILDARTVYRSRERRRLFWEETAKMVCWIQHDVRKSRTRPPPR